MINHQNRNLTRYRVSLLIGKAWSRAATPANAIAGFRGIPSAVPEHIYAISDLASQSVLNREESLRKTPKPEPGTSKAYT